MRYTILALLLATVATPALAQKSDPAAPDEAVKAAAEDAYAKSTPAVNPAVPDKAASAAAEDPYQYFIQSIPELYMVVNTQNWTDRRAELTKVDVIDVISDRVFWVGKGPNQRVLVVLDEQVTSQTKVEAQYNIEPGMTLSVFGQLAALPISADLRAALHLDEQTRSKLDKGDVYLFAQKVTGIM